MSFAVSLLRLSGSLLAPQFPSEKEIGAWRDQMHKLSEARASVSGFSRADIEAFRAACPDDVARSIALRDGRAPLGPTSPGPASVTTTSSNVPRPVGTSGWAREIPLSNPPGTNYVDMLCEVDAAKQRGEAMVAEARRKAAEDKQSD